MTEIEELKQQIASLEEMQRGTEIAVINLALAICSHAHLDLAAVASSFQKLISSEKEHLALGAKSDIYAPADTIAKLLTVAGEVVNEALAKDS